MPSELDALVFVAFNSRVAALDRRDGNLVWQWKSPKGSGFVAILLDQEKLFVSVHGYTYALDPRTGAQLWNNDMSGFGFGVSCIATVRGHSPHPLLGQSDREQQDSAPGSGGVVPGG